MSRPYIWKSSLYLKTYILLHNCSGVARASRVGEPHGWSNWGRKFTKNERKYRRMRKRIRKCSFLPTPGWESGYAPAAQWLRTVFGNPVLRHPSIDSLFVIILTDSSWCGRTRREDINYSCDAPRVIRIYEPLGRYNRKWDWTLIFCIQNAVRTIVYDDRP